jgi:hypothetical protein
MGGHTVFGAGAIWYEVGVFGDGEVGRDLRSTEFL